MKRAAAFELVPLLPELPVVMLASDGTLCTRKWVYALQEAIDAPAATPGVADGSDDVGSSVAHGIRAGASAANGAGDSGSSGATPQPAPETPSAAVDESPLKPITENLAAVMEYSNAKIDEVQSRSPRHLTALALPVAASCGAPS